MEQSRSSKSALPQDMLVELERIDETIAVARITGTLDRFSCQRLKDVLIDAVGAGSKELIIDLTDVTTVDSSGLGVLIVMFQRARLAGGGLRLTGLNERLTTILTTMSLDQVLHRDQTVQDAISYFRST